MAAPTPPGWGPSASPPPPWAPPPYVQYSRETPGIAIAALILGLVSITACWIIGWLPGGIALVLGTRAKRQIDADPARYEGRGLALAGQIVGACGIVAGVLIDIVYLVIIVFAIVADPSSPPPS